MAARHERRIGVGEQGEVYNVAVIYEDIPACETAIHLCQRLEQQFENELAFEFTWWRFKYLSDLEIAHEAAQAAVGADVIVLSLRDPQNIPLPIKVWFEQWVLQRKASKGALVVLHRSNGEHNRIEPQDSYLRFAARRAHLDLLFFGEPVPAPEPADGLPEEPILPDTVGLFEVPSKQYHSSGWGLNE